MEVKEHILTTAIELFLKEGVRRVTMDQLAASLGMSKRTIYELFNTKDELLKQCIDNHISKQRDIILELAEKSETALHFYLSLMQVGASNMKSQNPQFVNDVRIYYPKIWSSTLCANRDYNIEQTSILLVRGIEEGVFRADINLAIISKIIVEFLTLLANSDIFPYHQYSPSEMFEQTLLTIIRGISSSKGIKIVDKYISSQMS